ncbi:hypothetical protein BDW69DRAFT_51133 [Aspergillus filifer]
MLDDLPPEILLLIFKHLDGLTLTKLYRLSRRLGVIVLLQLHDIYGTRTIELQPFELQDPIGDKHTLKFVQELVINDDVPVCYHDPRSGPSNHSKNALIKILVRLEKELTKDGLISFRWKAGNCVPRQILGPEGFLSQYQRNIRHLSLDTTKCRKRHSNGHAMSISALRQIRDFSWKGLGNISDCISLKAFLDSNGDHLEELELDMHHALSTNLQDWQGSNGNENTFAYKVLRLEEGQKQVMTPCLKKLSLCRADLNSGMIEIVHALQLHKIRSLTLRKCTNTSGLLNTIVDVSSVMQLTSIDIEIDAANNENVDAFRRFFELPFPNLQDVFLHVDAWDDESTCIHWQSIFVPGRHLKRFVYHRRLEDRDEAERDLSTPPDTAVELNEEMLSLLSSAKLQCVGLCEDPANLMEKLTQPNVHQLEWEILNIRTAPTYLNRRLHNLKHAISTSQLGFEAINDLLDVYTNRFSVLPCSISQIQHFLSGELLEFFTFAAWAFGPTGLPKLDLLVYGEVNDVYLSSDDCIYLCRNPNTAPLCLPFRRLDIIGPVSGDDDSYDQMMRRKFQSHAAFFETMVSSEWEF